MLVVDEWLIHDLRGDNGRKRQYQADRFLDELLRRCSRIVFVEGSTWAEKAYELMKHVDPIRRQLSKKLHSILCF